MGKNKAIVIGALGQDGSFMCDILLENGYDVFGLIRPGSDESRFNPKVSYIKESVYDIKKILLSIKPDHVYNFMGVTNVFDPWANSDVVYESNFIIPWVC